MLPLGLDELVGEELDLNGLWRGDYGPHGIETVEVRHHQREIVATKVTGDPHVPAGEVTFRAILEGWGGPGEGQIAERNHVNARFVPGRFAIRGRNVISFEWLGLGAVVLKRVH